MQRFDVSHSRNTILVVTLVIIAAIIVIGIVMTTRSHRPTTHNTAKTTPEKTAKDLTWQSPNLGSDWVAIQAEDGQAEYQQKSSRCTLTLVQPSGLNDGSTVTSSIVAASFAVQRAESLASSHVVIKRGATGTRDMHAVVDGKTKTTLNFASIHYASANNATTSDTYAYASGDYALVAIVTCGGSDATTFKTELDKVLDSLTAQVTY